MQKNECTQENNFYQEEKMLVQIQQILSTFEMDSPTQDNPISLKDVEFLLEQVVKYRSLAERLTGKLYELEEIQRSIVDLSKGFKTRGKNHRKHNSALLKQVLTIIASGADSMKQTIEPLETNLAESKSQNQYDYNFNKIPSFKEVESFYHKRNVTS